MLVFEPKKHHLREVLLYFFNGKKSAIESHPLLVEAHGEPDISETTCRDWFRCFNNDDFHVEGQEGQNLLKMQNWRHYSMKIHIKRKENLQNHWKLLHHFHAFKSIGNYSKPKKLGIV